MTCPFEQYLALPGWSYSGIKHEGKTWSNPTPKMQLGTKVDDYLTSPEQYNHDDKEIVKPIALALKNKLGVLLKYLKPQLCFTADFIFDGYLMKYKGRADWAIPGRIVIDGKVTEMPIRKGIDYFGYNYQVNGYAIALNCPVMLILAAHSKSCVVEVANIATDQSWWQEQIKLKGEKI